MINPSHNRIDSSSARRRFLCSVLAAITCVWPFDAAAQSDQFAPVRKAIRAQMEQRNVPSIAVAVARDGRIIWEEGFGWADRERRIAATPHTSYSLASISKPFTATALMILRQRGLLDLDRPLNDYLGEARIRVRVGEAKELTTRRVANHSAGLPLHYQFFYADESMRPPSPEETIRRYGNTITAPGERYQYSNLGYGILDHLITRITGRQYDEFMRNEVFIPLGMTRSTIALRPLSAVGLDGYEAVRYGTDGLPIPFYEFDHPGASAVYASAHDLVRFGMFHLKAHLPDQRPIIDDGSIDEMQRPTMKAEDVWSYGIGWRSGIHSSGRRVVFHTGGMGGVNTILCLLPDERIAFAVLANANNDLIGRPPLPNVIRDEIIAALFPGSRQAASPSAAPPRQFTTPPALLGRWSGRVETWRGELPLSLEFQADGDVHARLGAQLLTLLNRPNFENGYLTGTMSGDIGTDDANRTRYVLGLALKLRGETLSGGTTALTLPGRRVGNALTYWTELKRQ